MSFDFYKTFSLLKKPTKSRKYTTLNTNISGKALRKFMNKRRLNCNYISLNMIILQIKNTFEKCILMQLLFLNAFFFKYAIKFFKFFKVFGKHGIFTLK